MSDLADRDRAKRILDILLDRPAPPAPPASKVTIEEIVRRKTSIVRVGGKLYRIRATEVELTG